MRKVFLTWAVWAWSLGCPGLFYCSIGFVCLVDFTYIFLNWFQNVIPALFRTSGSSYVNVIHCPPHKFVVLVLAKFLKSILFTKNVTVLAAVTFLHFFFNFTDSRMCTCWWPPHLHKSNVNRFMFWWPLGLSFTSLLEPQPAICAVTSFSSFVCVNK